jgi:hypothetical protein
MPSRERLMRSSRQAAPNIIDVRPSPNDDVDRAATSQANHFRGP